MHVCILCDTVYFLCRMGKIFGNLGVHARHIIQYSLSPFEQRAFAGFYTNSPGNLLRRFMEEAFYIVPGMTTGFLVYYYAKKDFNRRQRKNPADYENEE